jgi:hypothetical protein
MIIALITILAAALVLYAVVITGAGTKKKSKHRRSIASSRGSRGYLDTSEIQARWETIMAASGTGASGLKSSINEADKLVDHVLMQIGLSGDTMGERLKSARSRFPEYSVYDSLWRAHKLRNSLAHDVEFDLVPSQAREALRDFEHALKDLGALK